MEKYRDKAIDDPTSENVSTYMYLQRVMLDKAEKFADASQKLVMRDAVLDENARRPIATFGAFAKDDMSNRGIQKAAKKLAAQEEARATALANKTFDPFEGGFPVPPLPGQQPLPSRHQTLTVTAKGEGN